MRKAALACAALVLFARVATAEEPSLKSQLERALSLTGEYAITSAEAGPGCDGGIQYDDGSFENAVATTTSSHNFVMEFDLPGAKNTLKAACVCFSRGGTDTTLAFRLNVYAADGPSGGPGTLLGFVTPTFTSPPLLGRQFARVEFPGEGLAIPSNRVFLGPAWSELLDPDHFICLDETGPGQQLLYFGSDLVSAPTIPINDPDYHSLGIRIEAENAADPEPPAGPWLTTSAIPAFQFKALITAGANQITPSLESDCLAETLCLSGALPGRSELFARIIGPRPNGFLWVNLVRFTISQVEVWVQRRTGGDIRYYKLPAIPSGSDELTGLVDKQAFTP